MAPTLLSVLLLGFALGLRHATDADHVVAVGTIVGRERSLSGAARVGGLWGLGHTLTLLVVGGAIISFSLVVPPRLGLSLELGVALMLVGLGMANLVGRVRKRTAPSPPGSRARPLLVGTVHGLAGSAAIALLVLASIRSAGLAFVYLGVFGCGTLVGMVALTVLMALPLRLAADRSRWFERGFARVSGLLSVALGLFLAYRIGLVDGLFTGDPRWTPH